MRRHLLFLSLAILAAVSPAFAQSTTNRVLVVPFDNRANEPSYHWLAEASAVLLADSLRDRGAPALIRTERVRAFEQLHLPPAASLSRATVIKVAQLVGAGEVIVGTFSVENEQFTVTANSIRVDVGRLQPQVTERGPLTELFAIFERLSGRLTHESSSLRRAEVVGRAAAARCIRELHQGADRREPGEPGDVPRGGDPRASGLRSRAARAVGGADTIRGMTSPRWRRRARCRPSSPLAGRARFSAGVSLLELKRYDEAFDTFKKLLDEGSASSRDGIGVEQPRRGSDPARKHAADRDRRVLSDQGHRQRIRDPDYFFNLGYAYFARAQLHRRAIYWLREALRRDPTDADAHFVLAAALQATGSVQSKPHANVIWRASCRRVTRSSIVSRRTTGWLFPTASSGCAMDPATPLATARGQGDRQLGAARAARARDVPPRAGRRLFEREQDREAMAELRRAVYLSPYEAQAHLLIGRIHLRAGRAGGAIDALKISIWSEDTAAARIALARPI